MMKKLIFILFLFTSAIIFSQNSPLVPSQGGIVDDKFLGNEDQYLLLNRLISGSDSSNLHLDSIPIFYVTADQVFITDDVTSLLNIIGTTTRWNTSNSGLIKFNDIGVKGMYMQEVYNDSIFRVYTTQGSAGIQALDREGAGITYYGADLSVKPNEIWTRVYDPSNITDSEIRVGFGRVQLYGADSLVVDPEIFNEALTVVMAIDTSTGRNYRKTIGASSGSVSYDTYTSGVVSSYVSRFSGTATGITNPSTGIYTYTVASGAHIMEIDFLGNDTNLNAGVLTLNIDNSANSRDRYFTVQILQRTTNGQVNAFATATNYTQSSSANVTTITISNLGGFGTTGYRLMLR